MKASALLTRLFPGLLLLVVVAGPVFASPTLQLSAHASAREVYAGELLRPVLARLPGHERVLLALRHDPLLAAYDRQIPDFWPDAKEAFVLRRIGDTVIVAGFDASGVLYGAEELAQRAQGGMPAALDFEDHPQLKLRGTAIGLQKPELTYENAEYDYRYTPQEFPWFYDKRAWTKLLDRMAEQRLNTLYLWNGHPFTSLLRLPKYPEAQELPTAQLEANIAMFQWLTAEADRRGIWVLQGFYNIHLSHAFARAHNVPFHLSAPTPLASEYTRYCISEFIRQYPNVGLFMTLGEAMGPHYGVEWMTKTIIPGVRDGLAEQAAAVGHAVPEPPLVVRAHATDIEEVMPAARALYPNLDTMWKWNGESFTWTNIRGPVLDRFKKLVAGSNTTIVNMHLESNLEPFRWGDPDFIRQTTVNFVRIGIGGVHVYPLRYWDWPYSADAVEPRLDQPDRDWIWYESWARYAWNPERDASTEKVYWTEQFAHRFAAPGVGTWPPPVLPTEAQTPLPVSYTAEQTSTGGHLLAAYELSGICAPTLLPRIGITEGNREVLSLGMTMPQMIDAKRFNPAETLWTGDAPEGERLDEYIANEEGGKPHHGQNPIGVAAMVADASAKAVSEAEAAGPGIAPAARAEYGRVVNDMRAIAALMQFYDHKIQAAADVLRFAYDGKQAHLTDARTLLAASVDDFARLTALTETTYRDAAGMETSQRQIPVRGGPETNHWRDLLPVYRKELVTFDTRLKTLNSPGAASAAEAKPQRLAEVGFTLNNDAASTAQRFTLEAGQALSAADEGKEKRVLTIASVAPELAGLTGVRVAPRDAAPLHFTLTAPAQILVGFLRPGNANLSSATEQWNLVLPAAVVPVKGQPLSVWAKPLPAGRNDLDLGVGAYVVLGFIPEATHITPHVDFSAARTKGQLPNLDWLFED